jgi:uncharacterized protein YcgI (DUF1989 family)
MNDRMNIPAASGAALRLARGQRLRVIDPLGGQTGDLVAFSADGAQRQSNGRSFDYNGKVYLTTGDVIWSDRSEKLLTIVEDSVGRHDFLYSPCSLEMYKLQYGVTDYHPNCHDNLYTALRELGIRPDSMPTALNFFMVADVGADGRLTLKPPTCQAGDSFVVQAEIDLAIGLTACPTSSCNGGRAPQPLAYEIED